MEFKDIAQAVWDQFVTVWNAPVPFLAAVIAAFIYLRWQLSGKFETRLANAESTEKLLERQLQEYKDKTGSDTPDAVKARIDALETRLAEMVPRLAALGPRKVTAEQRQKMVPLLDPFRGSLISVASDAGSADAAQMSKGLVAAFNSAGWLTTTPMVMGLGNPPPTGIALAVADPKNLTGAEAAVADALLAGGLDFDLQAGGSRMSMPGHPAPAAEITLTTRLED